MAYDSCKYSAVCLYCGKSSGIRRNGSIMGGPPTSLPSNMAGRCPASPSGKHAPRWQSI